MAKNDDLDMSLDGFDPGETYHRPTRENRRKAPVDAPEAAEPQLRRKEKAEPKTSKPKESSRDDRGGNAFVRFFTDERLRIFLGLALILSFIFITVALVSHIKYGDLDQSLVENMSPNQIVGSNEQVRNTGGAVGAWMARVFLSDSLGLGSIAFIVYAAILALGLLGLKKCNFWSVTFKTLLVAITTSMVLGLVFYATPSSSFCWGGLHGYFINRFLITHTSWIGALAVSLLLIAAVVCVYLDELRLAWRKWRDRINRSRLQEELKKNRENKAKKLDEVGDEAAQEAEAENSPQAPEQKPEHDNSAPVRIADSFDDIIDDDEPEEETKPHTPLDNQELPDAGESNLVIDMSDRRNAGQAQGPADNEEQNPATAEADEPEAPAEEGFSIAGIAAGQPAASDTFVQGNFSVTAPQIEVADDFDNPENEGQPGNDALSQQGPYDHRAELSHYQFPSIELLAERKQSVVIDMEEQQANKDRIVKTLLDYKIPISKIEATVGPTVTLYEIVPAEGVRISQIKRLEDDIALSLSALGIRIIAPIPGKGTVGIEVPNSDPQTVSMRSVITSKKFQETKMALPMAMGATISNDIFIADLAKMPHLLVAGATGMGKSVGLNAIIASLLYKKHPSELKFVLVDPKMVEFSLYSKLERHYMAKLPMEEDAIITDPSKVILTLNSLCVEMDDRYALLRKANVRSLEEYNAKFTERKLNPANGHKYLPYIVVIVDEFADLIMTAGKEVETPIARIAQKARAVGMHMIIATQRPSTNVITGIIKANFPGRIAFRVNQMVDSKTILDRTGANQLIGRGDMLFSQNGSMERVQCAFISTEEVVAICDSIDEQVGYEHAYYLPEVQMESGDDSIAGASSERDPLFDEAARFVVSHQIASTSTLQRHFKIGYTRAGRMMDQMEAAGIVGPVNGAKPRDIRVDSITLENILGQ